MDPRSLLQFERPNPTIYGLSLERFAGIPIDFGSDEMFSHTANVPVTLISS